MQAVYQWHHVIYTLRPVLPPALTYTALPRNGQPHSAMPSNRDLSTNMETEVAAAIERCVFSSDVYLLLPTNLSIVIAKAIIQ